MFTDQEILLVSLLAVTLVGIIVYNFFSKAYYSFWSPMTMFSLYLLYYAVIGPIVLIINDDTVVKTVDHRDYFQISWTACLVSVYCVLLGFMSKRKISKRKLIKSEIPVSKLVNISIRIVVISMVLFTIYAGGDIIGRINFIDNTQTEGEYAGSLRGYLMYAPNLLIVAVLLLLISFNKKRSRILFLVLFLLSVSIFINEAFRYRLVVIVIGALGTYYLSKKTKPNFIALFSVIGVFVLFMGIMEVTRQYGRGLNLEKANDYETEEFMFAGMNETKVFMSTGLLIESLDESKDFTYFDFLTNTIASPIPRAIWPSKPDGSYMLRAWKNLYGTSGDGQAFLYFSEYFNAFGWIGLIILSFLLGYIFKVIWLWFILNKDNNVAIVTLACFNGFIYVIVSRGYFPQQVTLFFFTVYPAFLIISLYKKRYLTKYQQKIPEVENKSLNV